MTERWQAERDEVTGMPGRTMLLRALDERLAGKRPFALGCIDDTGLTPGVTRSSPRCGVAT